MPRVLAKPPRIDASNAAVDAAFDAASGGRQEDDDGASLYSASISTDSDVHPREEKAQPEFRPNRFEQRWASLVQKLLVVAARAWSRLVRGQIKLDYVREPWSRLVRGQIKRDYVLRWASLVRGQFKQDYVRQLAHEQMEYLKHVTGRLKALPEDFWSQRMKVKAKAKAKANKE